MADELTGFFETYGWKYERAAAGLFRTGFLGECGHQEIWVQVSDAWVFFTISPYVRRPPSGRHGPCVLRCMLRVNQGLRLAKLALDDEGDIVLTVELPADGFCYSHFADALTGISQYADLHRHELDAAVETDSMMEPT